MQTGVGAMARGAIGTLLLLSAVTACGGGGGAGPPSSAPGSSPPSGAGNPSPSPSPSASPAGTGVAGTVMQIPSDGFGPATILGVTYAFDSSGTPLAGATVIVGPVPITGATPPATLPSGDVSTKTSATGSFSASVPTAPAAPALSEPFVIPTNNITGFVPPSTGYYVQVFGSGTDGVSAGVPLPLHSFLAPSTSLALHVTTATSVEAGALAIVNSDRQSNSGSGPLTFDEATEEAARLHASDLVANTYYCHYDTRNAGPSSRFLQVGGVGLTGEGIGGAGGVLNALTGFQQAENTFLAEKSESPPGGHYTNLVDSAHLWAGLGVVASTVPQAYVVDYELVTPNAVDSVVGSSGYPVTAGCAAGTTDNNS